MYEVFEHTADLGIRVRAGSLAELFADAGRGLVAQLANLDVAGALRNVIGSTLGNVVGGAVLVGLVYWFVYLRPGSRPGEEAQGEEEVEEEGER